MGSLLVFGAGCIGYLFPEFCVAIGGGGARFPVLTNIVSMMGFAAVAGYFAFGA